jgi:N-methylhydantoinase A
MPGVENPRPAGVVAGEIERQIGAPLSLDAYTAASAILSVTINHLAGAIRLVSIERGEDPRDYALFAFGGAGALHATALARELGIPKVIVPRFPGATSALGCTLADLRHDFVRTIRKPLLECSGAEIDTIYREHRAAGERMVTEDGVAVEQMEVTYEADLLFLGQTHVFRIPVSAQEFIPERVLESFQTYYGARFDIDLREMRAILANVRTTVLGVRPKFKMDVSAPISTDRQQARTVWFDGKSWETPVIRRENLPVGSKVSGPAIIEQMDATTVLEPHTTLCVDVNGNLIISIGEAA